VRRVVRTGTKVLGGTRRRRCNPRTPGRSGRSGRTGLKGGRFGRTERMGRTHAVRARALSVWSKCLFLLMHLPNIDLGSYISPSRRGVLLVPRY